MGEEVGFCNSSASSSGRGAPVCYFLTVLWAPACLGGSGLRNNFPGVEGGLSELAVPVRLPQIDCLQPSILGLCGAES